MKFLILCLFVVIAVAMIKVRGNSVPASPYAFGTKIKLERTPLTCQGTVPECAADCNTLMICTPFSNDPLTTVQCPAPNKYCVNGACTSNPGTNPNCAANVGSGFKCTSDGLFPEPSDCTKYHVCLTGSTTETYQCGPGFVFNSQLGMCQIGKTPCTKISCSKPTEANTFISYASNPAFYAFCMVSNGGVEPIMFKCPYEQVFDLKTKTCQFKCRAKGNFQNPLECGEYYYCSGNNAQPILAKCPNKWVFDGTGCSDDPNKCKFTTTTTTTTTPDPLSAETIVDAAIQAMVDKLKEDIVPKVCAIIDDVNEPLCPPTATSPFSAVLKANQYKTENAEPLMFFVSVTVIGEDYHVKIFNDTPDPVLRGVEGPMGAADEIVHFADN